MPEFCHLHCHTHFSLLDGASHLGPLMDKAKADGQKGLAMTDHGNMFSAFKFVSEAKKRDLKAMSKQKNAVVAPPAPMLKTATV